MGALLYPVALTGVGARGVSARPWRFQKRTVRPTCARRTPAFRLPPFRSTSRGATVAAEKQKHDNTRYQPAPLSLPLGLITTRRSLGPGQITRTAVTCLLFTCIVSFYVLYSCRRRVAIPISSQWTVFWCLMYSSSCYRRSINRISYLCACFVPARSSWFNDCLVYHGLSRPILARRWPP